MRKRNYLQVWRSSLVGCSGNQQVRRLGLVTESGLSAMPRLSGVQCVGNGYPATLALLVQRCDLRLCEAFGWCSRSGRPWLRGLGEADAEVQRAAGVADHPWTFSRSLRISQNFVRIPSSVSRASELGCWYWFGASAGGQLRRYLRSSYVRWPGLCASPGPSRKA